MCNYIFTSFFSVQVYHSEQQRGGTRHRAQMHGRIPHSCKYLYSLLSSEYVKSIAGLMLVQRRSDMSSAVSVDVSYHTGVCK